MLNPVKTNTSWRPFLEVCLKKGIHQISRKKGFRKEGLAMKIMTTYKTKIRDSHSVLANTVGNLSSS